MLPFPHYKQIRYSSATVSHEDSKRGGMYSFHLYIDIWHKEIPWYSFLFEAKWSPWLPNAKKEQVTWKFLTTLPGIEPSLIINKHRKIIVYLILVHKNSTNIYNFVWHLTVKKRAHKATSFMYVTMTYVHILNMFTSEQLFGISHEHVLLNSSVPINNFLPISSDAT